MEEKPLDFLALPTNVGWISDKLETEVNERNRSPHLGKEGTL